MNKIIILVMMTAMHLHSSEGLSQDVCTVYGLSDSISIQLSLTVVNSIPEFEEQLKNPFTKKLQWPADQESLNFLQQYASCRQLLKAQGNQVNPQVETALENKIKQQSLEQLACTTVMIGDMYGEVLPQGFDVAWKHQLNEERVGKGQVEHLITKKETVDFIFVLQDQSKPFPLLDSVNLGSDGNTGEPGSDQQNQGLFCRAWENLWRLDKNSDEDLQPVYRTQEQQKQDRLNKKNDDTKSQADGKKPREESSVSRFARFKKVISDRLSQMEPVEKVVYGALPFVVFFMWYKLSHRG